MFFIYLILLLCTFAPFAASSPTHAFSLKRPKYTIEDYEQMASLEDVQYGSAAHIPFKYGLIPLTPELYDHLGVIPLVNFLNAQFYGEAQLGTPAQTLKIMFDSGSSNMFVLAPNCTGLACWGRTYYNYTLSDSFFLNGSHIRLDFGSGNFTGFIGADIVAAGDLAAQNFSFAVIDEPDAPFFLYSRFDGIIGLAYDNLAVNNIPTFFHVLLEQKVITESSYSFYLTKDLGANGSALILGGIDKKYAKSEFHYVNLTHESYFMTGLDDFKVGNDSYHMKKNMSVILDSGTSILVGPEKFIKKIIKLYPKSINCDDVTTYPDLHFVIGGRDYVIPPDVYIIENFGHCILGIVGAIFPPELKNTIILGDVFMRQYYTHFDYGNTRLGFAEAANITTEDEVESDKVTHTTTTTIEF